MRALLAAIVGVVALSFPLFARAFDPEPGNRAYPLAGTDMISGQWIDLEDYRGRWVLLCFWTSG
jgi:hypothetical protein